MSNNVTLVGNLVEDPELRFTPSGVAVANIRLAVNRRYMKDGEWQEEETSYFRGSCWREMAENAAESFTKGMRVIVIGRLKQRSWETKEGERRYEVEIDIQELGPSIRWATAAVTKTPRSGGNWGDQAPTAPAAPVARTEFGPDEAPF